MPSGLDGNPRPIRTPARDAVLAATAAAAMAVRRVDGCTVVAIDGIDGSGKSTFGDELADVLRSSGVHAIRSTTDSFHNPRAVRWARGKSSPEGFYIDSHDFTALRHRLLDPLSDTPPAPYRAAAFDEPNDAPVDAPVEHAPPGAVLVFDGLFLQRPELRSCWDLVVWLDGQARVDRRRMAWAAEGCPPGVAALPHLVGRWALLRRYHEGVRRYVDACDPIAGADVVIDNVDLRAPRVVRPS